MTQWHNMSRNHIYFASIQWTLCCFFCFVAQGAVRCRDTEIQVSCSLQRINTTCLWVWQNGVERMLVRQKISTDWRLVPWNCYLKASLWISAILWHRRAIFKPFVTSQIVVTNMSCGVALCRVPCRSPSPVKIWQHREGKNSYLLFFLVVHSNWVGGCQLCEVWRWVGICFVIAWLVFKHYSVVKVLGVFS